MKFFIEWVLSPLVWVLTAYLFHYSVIGWIIGLIVSFIFKEFIAPVLVTLIQVGITHISINNHNNTISENYYLTPEVYYDKKKSEDFFQEGMEKYKNKKYDEALFFFTRALNMNNKNSRCYFYRGNSYFGKKEYTNAKNEYDIAISLCTQYSEAYFNRACCWYHLNQKGMADKDIQTAIKLGNKDAIKLWSSTFKN
ncbi:MAG: hypothetical protein M1480_13850 [Bacteroidetes bacterium]|nr:hypothetical protein [Bacteroidota bacterium]